MSWQMRRLSAQRAARRGCVRMKMRYVIALGSNQWHHRYGPPRKLISSAVATLARQMEIVARSRVISSAPVGPSQRDYANAAILVETPCAPEDLLAQIKAIERDFGRKMTGQPWRARTLDLDIILWSGGVWAGDTLIIPHTDFRERRFVLGPLAEIAPAWRDPISGLNVAHLKARLDRNRHSP